MITYEELRKYLSYDPLTGIFTWNVERKSYKGGRKVGDQAGTPNAGYIIIGLLGRQYKAHRLAWLYMYGEWPNNYIDHLNCIRSDNRISNLRDVKSGPNLHNRAVPPSGVIFKKDRNSWAGRIGVNGKQVHLGNYGTEAEAKAARIGAEKVLISMGIKIDKEAS